MRVVMFTWGNPARGDDAVGPWMADRFRQRGDDSLSLVEDFQLQVEHLLDCRDAQLMLFVDACSGRSGNFHFEEVQPGGRLSHTSHALSPAELLGCYARTFSGERPAPAFQLAVPGENFELGQAMSRITEQRCERAAEFIECLLEEPNYRRWRNMTGEQVHP